MEARGMQTFRIGEGKEKLVIDHKKFSYPLKNDWGQSQQKSFLYSVEIKSGQWT